MWVTVSSEAASVGGLFFRLNGLTFFLTPFLKDIPGYREPFVEAVAGIVAHPAAVFYVDTVASQKLIVSPLPLSLSCSITSPGIILSFMASQQASTFTPPLRNEAQNYTEFIEM